MTNEQYEVVIGVLSFIIILIIFIPLLLKKLKEEEAKALKFQDTHIALLKSIDESLKKIRNYEDDDVELDDY